MSIFPNHFHHSRRQKNQVFGCHQPSVCHYNWAKQLLQLPELRLRVKVGCKMLCRDFSQRVIPFEFFDDKFDGRPAIVKSPDMERNQFHIGYNNLIAVFAHGEKRKLFRRVFWDETPDHHKTIFLFPFCGLIHELRGLQTRKMDLIG